MLKGTSATPFDAMQTLSRQFALLGVTGAVRMALSLLDMAMWDAMAQMQRVPLSSLLGDPTGQPKPLRAYDSRGLRADGAGSPRQRGRKPFLGGGGSEIVQARVSNPSLFEDLAALRAVRRGISGGDVAIMVDYNQALTSTEAILRGRELEKEGDLIGSEEPIAHDDYMASAEMARELKGPDPE